MAIVKMKRIELIAMMSDSKAIMDIIQQYGKIELTDYEENENFYKISTSTALSQLEKFRTVALDAQKILNQYAPVKSPVLNTLMPRRAFTVSEYFFKSQEADAILSKCYTITSLYKDIQDKRATVLCAQTAIESLQPWADLDIPISFGGTENTSAFIGYLPKTYKSEALLGIIKKELPDIDIEIEIVSSQKGRTYIVALCHKDNGEKLENTLQDIGFVAPHDKTEHPPADKINRLKNDIEKFNADIIECEEKIKSYADSREQIDFLTDYFVLRKDKYSALNKISMSNNVFVVSGFLPEDDAVPISEKLEALFDVAISITDPDPETEEVPVLLKNEPLAASVAPVTELYAVPKYQGTDPSSAMAIFYYFLFGLMLPDAGYGLLMIIVSLFLKFGVRPEKHKIKVVDSLFFCGIGSVFWGVMFGSFFGNIIQMAASEFLGRNIIITAVLFEPFRSPIAFLLFVLVIGIVHLIFTNGVRFYALCKNGKTRDAIFDVIPVLLLLIGVIPWAAKLFGGEAAVQSGLSGFISALYPLSNYMLLMGAVILLLTAGRKSKSLFGKIGMGFYGLLKTVLGFLFDMLSYTRIFAVGLFASIAAVSINTLAVLPDDVALKIMMLIMICFIGHPLNIAVSMTAAYISANRIQFISFLPKVYEGGGRPFMPLKARTKYFRFKEEKK